jgi:hypothetical protein
VGGICERSIIFSYLPVYFLTLGWFTGFARFKQAIKHNPKEMEGILRGMENDTMLKKLPLMEEIANTAVFLASDLGKSITGVTIDVTGGTTAGLNYRMGPNADQGNEPGPL